MDYKRLAITAVVAWVVDAIYGMTVWMGMLGDDMARNAGVFRSEAAMNSYMPLMFAGSLVGMFVLACIYAKGYEGGSGLGEGFRFGLLLAIFMTGFVSIGIYGSFNIDSRLGLLASIVSFVEMVIVGTVIGAVYRRAPAAVAARV
jgi:hypothetical protein